MSDVTIEKLHLLDTTSYLKRLDHFFEQYTLQHHGLRDEGQIQDPESGLWFQILWESSALDAGIGNVYVLSVADFLLLNKAMGQLDAHAHAAKIREDLFSEERTEVAINARKKLFADLLQKLETAMQTGVPVTSPFWSANFVKDRCGKWAVDRAGVFTEEEAQTIRDYRTATEMLRKHFRENATVATEMTVRHVPAEGNVEHSLFASIALRDADYINTIESRAREKCKFPQGVRLEFKALPFTL